MGLCQQGRLGLSRCLPSPESGHRLKETFLVTGSQDCTVKFWPLPEALLSKGTGPEGGPVLLQAQATQRCHDKVTARSARVGSWPGPRQDGGLSGCLLSPPGHQQCGRRPQ